MASSPTEPEPQFFAAPDGTRLAWREMGEGRPVVLLHGLFSSAVTNWIRYGHAAAIAARGFRVILPDLRAHGASDGPHDPARYPSDILAEDGLALVAHLGLGAYDLGGYSLGARTAVRMLARGAAPRRAVLAGMGLDGLVHASARSAHFRAVLTGLGTHPRGSDLWRAEAFLKSNGGDPDALLPLFDSFVDTPRDVLRALALPVLVVAGQEDADNGSAADLAALLPDARFAIVPGNHMSAVARPELGQAIADFLAG